MEIAVATTGFYFCMQGPASFLTNLTFSKSEDLLLDPGKVTYCWLGFPSAYKSFVVNMTVSADLNLTEAGLQVFLLNETQFENWNSSSTEFTLKREYPDYNFSAKVEPDEYYLFINGNLTERLAVSCIHQADAVAQDFDYEPFWQFFFLTLAGIIGINANIVLMKKERMFIRIDNLFERMCKPWVKLPQESSKGYKIYQAFSYRKFFRPLLSFCIQYLPLLFMIVVFLIGYSRLPVGNYIIISGVELNFVCLSMITAYPFLLLTISSCLLLIAFATFRTRDLEYIISRRLGILKRAYLDESIQIGSLTVATLREKKMITVISTPIMLLFGILLAFQNYFFRIEQREITPLAWAFVLVFLAYYGLVFAYVNSKIIHQTLGHARRAQIDVYRKNSLLHGILDFGCSVLSFLPIVVLVLIILVYGWLPTLSASLAAKYGLLSSPPTNMASLFLLVMEIVIFGYLLFTFIFTGILGYLVPTLLERGVRGPIVAFVALILTFITDRSFSFVLKPYVDTDLIVSLFPSFAVFVLVLTFEKFYKRILSPIEQRK